MTEYDGKGVYNPVTGEMEYEDTWLASQYQVGKYSKVTLNQGAYAERNLKLINDIQKVRRDTSKSERQKDEEIAKLKELQSKYLQITAEFGQVKVEYLILEQQSLRLQEYENSLVTKYTNLQNEEETLAKKLNEKYCTGNIDIDSGTFTSVS